jgi:NodT family efflux transporter outer membrane factor (OMF) lipoprotein
MLGELIERAYQRNRDVAAAEARLRASRATWTGERGAMWPSVGASVDVASRDADGGRAVETWQGGFDAAWEADLFGGQRLSADAARVDSERAQADLADVQRSIAAEIAVNYVAARSAQARLQVARESLGYQDETLQIARWRNQAGLVSVQDVEQATVLRSQTASAVPQLQSSFVNAANRIAVLLGEAPGSITPRLQSPMPIPLGPDDVGVGIPADLLRRRPDVAAAERSLAAEVMRIGVAESALYPALRLGGSLTSAAASAADLGTSMISTLVAGVTAPIFQGGQLRARVAAQRANADAALANYESTVLRALEDVDNAIDAIDAARERERQLAVAEEAAQNSATLARTRYGSGLIDFESLLEAERSLLTSREGRLSARADRATATVQLYKALGGGWVPGSDAMTARQ